MSNTRQQRGSRLGRIASYTALAVATFSALFPLFWTVSTSIKNRVDTFANPPKFVDFSPTAKNYRSLFDSPEFTKIYSNTIVVTGASTACREADFDHAP